VNAARLLRELALPMTEPGVLMSMLALFGLAKLASLIALTLMQYLLPLGAMLLLLASIVLLPVCARYLMEILDSRICGREPPPLSAGLFSRYGFVWSLLPLTLIFGSGFLLLRTAALYGAAASLLPAALLAVTVPASLAVLAMTNSPLSSLNPVSLYHLVRLSGTSYFVVPTILLVFGAALRLLSETPLPRAVGEFGMLYLAFLAFSLTGSIVASSGAHQHVGIAAPAMPDGRKLAREEMRGRQRVLDHAYGLFSRGNGAGGLEHIQDFIDNSSHLASKLELFEWFFRQMLDWENTDPALSFGRVFLSRLIAAGETVLIMKVTARCLLENERFRPLPGDRQRVIEMALANGRDDIARQLR
jgi:hypothetical protein